MVIVGSLGGAGGGVLSKTKEKRGKKKEKRKVGSERRKEWCAIICWRRQLLKVIKEHIIVFFMLCLRRSAGIGWNNRFKLRIAAGVCIVHIWGVKKRVNDIEHLVGGVFNAVTFLFSIKCSHDDYNDSLMHYLPMYFELWRNTSHICGWNWYSLVSKCIHVLQLLHSCAIVKVKICLHWRPYQQQSY